MLYQLNYTPDQINAYIEAGNKSHVDQIAACNHYEKVRADNPTTPRGSFAYNIVANIKAGTQYISK